MNFTAGNVVKWYRNLIRNPKYRWWIISGTLVYILSPLDLLPDMVPILGQIDDLAIITVLFTEVSSLIFEAVKARREGVETQVETNPASTEDTVDVEAVALE